jgi:hypothetical protein
MNNIEVIIKQVVFDPRDHDDKPQRTLCASSRVLVSVEDQAAGPYLEIIAENTPEGDIKEHALYFCYESQIDAFADVCKVMLAQAQEKHKGKVVLKCQM